MSTEQQDVSQETPNYGRLRRNSTSKEKREELKFFDSAEWAMRLSKNQRDEIIQAANREKFLSQVKLQSKLMSIPADSPLAF